MPPHERSFLLTDQVSHASSIERTYRDLRVAFPDHRCMRDGDCIAGLYARISEDREGLERGTTRQIEDDEEIAHMHGVRIGGRFSDDDIGASTRSKKRRTAYPKMLEAVRQGELCTIIAYSNSRLTRRPLELEELIKLYEDTGVLMLTKVSGRDDLSTAEGRMAARIRAAVDAAEAERTGERVKRASDDRREKGRVHGGPPIFGYVHPTPKNGYGYCRVLDEEAAFAVHHAAQLMIDGGSVSDVMKLWNERGLLTPGSRKPWTSPGDIQRFLSSPRIAGLTAHKGETLKEGDWTPIISRDVHLALVELCKPKKKHGSKPRKYLLPGFIFCGNCDSPMIANVSPQYGLNRYLCVKRLGCGKVSRDRPWIEDRVRRYVEVRITEQYEAQPEDQHVGLDRVRKEIDEVKSSIAALVKAVSMEIFTPEQAGVEMVELRQKLSAKNSEEARILRSAHRPRLDVSDALAVWRDQRLDTLMERREILGTFVEKIVVDPLSSDVAWGSNTALPYDCIRILPKEDPS